MQIYHFQKFFKYAKNKLKEGGRIGTLWPAVLKFWMGLLSGVTYVGEGGLNAMWLEPRNAANTQ